MNGERAPAPSGAKPVADDVSAQTKWGGGSAVVSHILRGRQQWSMRDADRREIESGPEMERKPRPARVISAGRVDEEDSGPRFESPHGPLEELTFA
jgi:hypothetical protein